MWLLATDLDGTLLNLNHKISNENKEAILRAQNMGIEVVPSTGRSLKQITKFFKEVNLDFNYVVSCNGSQVLTKDGTVIFETVLTKETAKTILDYLHNNNFAYSIFTETKTYSYYKNLELAKIDYEIAKKLDSSVKEEMYLDLIEIFTNHIEEDFIDYIDILEKEKIFKVSAISLNKEKLIQGLKELAPLTDAYISQTAYNNFEAIGNGCDKGTALEVLTDKLNISMDKVIAIGDNGNDISMLSKAKISIAMDNAHDDIKNLCTYTAPHHNESGFAYGIHKILDTIVT